MFSVISKKVEKRDRYYDRLVNGEISGKQCFCR